MRNIGEKTKYGVIVAIGWVGERYYWLKKNGVVIMYPARMVEDKT